MRVEKVLEVTSQLEKQSGKAEMDPMWKYLTQFLDIE